MSANADDQLPRHCSFEASDWHILARHWYAVALARDLDAGPLAAGLLDQPLVVYRAGAEIVVADDICPHRGVKLSLGAATARGIACAYHGLRFGAGGRCEHVPAHPDLKIPPRFHLRAYPAIERYGLVWTCLRPQAGAAPAIAAMPAAPAIAPMPHWDEAGFQQIVCPPFDIAGFAGRQMEGFLDVAHFGFVHTATFGDPDDVVVPPYDPVPHANGFSVDYRSTVSNYPLGAQQRNPPGFEWLRRFDVFAPFTATLTVHFPDDGRLAIMNAATPVSARRTRLFVPIARNFDTDRPVQEVYDFNRRVFEEDRAMVEAQMPEALPLDPRLEVHIPADRSSIAYRRVLRDMGLGRFFIA